MDAAKVGHVAEQTTQAEVTGSASRARVRRNGGLGRTGNAGNHESGLSRSWLYLQRLQGRVVLAWAVVIIAVLTFAILVGAHSLFRHLGYHSDAFDLGNMDQAVWNTLHGHPFRFTNRGADWQGPPTRLGIHVEPILLLIAPLYLIHSGPETLLILQTIALALGAVPLFLLGRKHLPTMPLTAAALACAYLVAPTLLGEALWDFHAVALATPLLLLAVWAMDSRRYGWFAVVAILAAATKEDVALALIPLGLYIAFWQKKPRYGLTVALISLLWVALCFLVILPHFNGGAAGGNNYWYRYAWAGTSAGDAVKNIATHPWWLLIVALNSAPRRGYLAMLLRTGGGLGLFAPALWVCALPELASNIYSTHPEMYSGFFQYNAMLVAFLSAASVFGVNALYRARLRVEQNSAEQQNTDGTIVSDAIDAKGEPGEATLIARLRRWMIAIQQFSRAVNRRWQALIARIPIATRWIGPVVICWLLITCYWNLTSADARLNTFWNTGAGPVYYQSATDALLAHIPANASVAATDTLDPHLSDRYDLYLLPDPQSYQAEYVAFDIPHTPQASQQQDQAIYNIMLASGRYVIVGTVPLTSGAIVLLHRIGPPLKPPGITRLPTSL